MLVIHPDESEKHYTNTVAPTYSYLGGVLFLNDPFSRASDSGKCSGCYAKRWQSQNPCVDLFREVGLKVESQTSA